MLTPATVSLKFWRRRRSQCAAPSTYRSLWRAERAVESRIEDMLFALSSCRDRVLRSAVGSVPRSQSRSCGAPSATISGLTHRSLNARQ